MGAPNHHSVALITRNYTKEGRHPLQMLRKPILSQSNSLLYWHSSSWQRTLWHGFINARMFGQSSIGRKYAESGLTSHIFITTAYTWITGKSMDISYFPVQFPIAHTDIRNISRTISCLFLFLSSWLCIVVNPWQSSRFFDRWLTYELAGRLWTNLNNMIHTCDFHASPLVLYLSETAHE